MTTTNVVDGDTIQCVVTLGPRAPLQGPYLWNARLWGIDAPELRRPETHIERIRALACKFMLEDLLGVGRSSSSARRQPIAGLVTVMGQRTPNRSGIDLYGRLVIQVVVEGRHLHEYLLEHTPCRPYTGNERRRRWKTEDLVRKDNDVVFAPYLQRAYTALEGYHDDMLDTSDHDVDDPPPVLRRDSPVVWRSPDDIPAATIYL